jgi:hypothetical protein
MQHACQPAVSGNPNGRPKEIMGAAYRRALLRKIPNDAQGRIFATPSPKRWSAWPQRAASIGEI